MSSSDIRVLIERWRQDADGTYRTWFLWDDRLKNFRSIRRGLQQVAAEIAQGAFGNAYRSSTLETVVRSVAEQRQIFRGADHAFLWKPKLRIPDIYENRDNQIAFGSFLQACLNAGTEAQLLSAVQRLDQMRIRGLGPAVANLLYFMHPTIMPPSNTAIVKGYNLLSGAKVKLGSWQDYLAMREGIVRMNAEHRTHLSNDLGAAGGFLFDVGSGRYAPPPGGDDHAREAWRNDLATIRALGEKERVRIESVREGERTHSEIQGWLRDLGRALGFEVWIAANDRTRAFGGGILGDGCLCELPPHVCAIQGGDSIRLIDVLWFSRSTATVEAAFEVEHTTSIYSGIMRMLDLALGIDEPATLKMFLVAPDDRKDEVRAQLARPAFRSVAGLHLRFLPYGELDKNREAICRFGSGIKPMEAIAQVVI